MIYFNCLIHNKECIPTPKRAFSKSNYLYCDECYKLYNLSKPLMDWFYSGSKHKKVDRDLKELTKSGNFKFYNYLVNAQIYDYFTCFTYIDTFLSKISISKHLSFPITKNFKFDTTLSIQNMKKQKSIYFNSNVLPISVINSKQFLSNILK